MQTAQISVIYSFYSLITKDLCVVNKTESLMLDSLVASNDEKDPLQDKVDLVSINQALEEENMILKNEVEIMKLQLIESDEVRKDLSKQLEISNSKITSVCCENTNFKDQIDCLLREIEQLKLNTQEKKSENVVKSISKPQIKKLIEPNMM